MSWEAFKQAARLQEPEQVPVGLIVDSPWLPGYAGIDTRDYYLLPDRWYAINMGLLDRFPDAVWIPGFWIEYGMAAEPSGFGVKLHFYPNRPPSVEPVVSDLAAWSEARPANPNKHGLMPLVLRAYELAEERLRAEGLGIRMVCSRGPMAVASFVMGITPLMMGFAKNPQAVNRVLETMTSTIIHWLHAQLDTLHQPEGIMLLDDLVGMVSKKDYQKRIDEKSESQKAIDDMFNVENPDACRKAMYEAAEQIERDRQAEDNTDREAARASLARHLDGEL